MSLLCLYTCTEFVYIHMHTRVEKNTIPVYSLKMVLLSNWESMHFFKGWIFFLLHIFILNHLKYCRLLPFIFFINDLVYFSLIGLYSVLEFTNTCMRIFINFKLDVLFVEEYKLTISCLSNRILVHNVNHMQWQIELKDAR